MHTYFYSSQAKKKARKKSPAPKFTFLIFDFLIQMIQVNFLKFVTDTESDSRYKLHSLSSEKCVFVYGFREVKFLFLRQVTL